MRMEDRDSGIAPIYMVQSLITEIRLQTLFKYPSIMNTEQKNRW